MNVLVVYASRHGSTTGIAERIAVGLREAGLSAEALPVAQATDVEGYDAFVIGAAAYMFHWLKDATRFVKRHHRLLAERPVWLFSSGPLGTDLVDEEGRDVLDATRPKEFDELRDLVHPRGEQVFFGAWDPDAPPIGLGERLIRCRPPRTSLQGTSATGRRSMRGLRASPTSSSRQRPRRPGDDMSATDTTPRAARASTTARPGRYRFRAIWATTLAGLLGLLFTALTAVTITLWATDAAYTETNPLVDLAFLALGLTIAVGFATQVRGRHVAGLQQVVLALGALAAAGWVGGRIEPFIGALVLGAAAVPLVVLHPDRRRLLAAGAAPSWPLTMLAAVGAVPAALYAADMLDLARAAGPSCFLGQCVQGDRYSEAAALAIAVVAVALLAAMRTPGWKLPVRSASAAAVGFGVGSLAFPEQVGALGAVSAVAAVVWGCALVVAAHVRRRRPAVPRLEGQGR